MRSFFLIVLTLFATNFVWWAWADAWLRKTGRRAAWRVAVAVYALAHAGLFVVLLLARRSVSHLDLPGWLVAGTYLWHLLVMPAVLIALIAWSSTRGVAMLARAVAPRRASAEPDIVSEDDIVSDNDAPVATDSAYIARPHATLVPTGRTAPAGPTRRQLLATALVAATPPVAELLVVSTALANMGSFRIRRFDITYRNLPAALDGATIAHLSDTHFGRFTKRADAVRIADATNRLGADVVAFTGDLIDFDLDDLDDGIDLLKRIKPPIVLCEGNHDLFQDRLAFENGVRDAGFPLLLNEARTIDVRGYPVQFLGMKWGLGTLPRDRSPDLLESAETTLAQHRPDGFGVLLAHHPHAFDLAALNGVNLTLGGHTHGGQLMLTDRIGPGPMMYKYWSGLYREADAACVISNGVGNWFPLRVNAPAEIVHITLKRA